MGEAPRTDKLKGPHSSDSHPIHLFVKRKKQKFHHDHLSVCFHYFSSLQVTNMFDIIHVIIFINPYVINIYNMKLNSTYLCI